MPALLVLLDFDCRVWGSAFLLLLDAGLKKCQCHSREQADNQRTNQC
jgi:hypothetical protein